jgi:hypothetical protein
MVGRLGTWKQAVVGAACGSHGRLTERMQGC